MIKKIFIGALFIFSSILLQAKAVEPLRATISQAWTVDMAREEAFKTVAMQIDINQIPQVDPNLIANRILLGKGGEQVSNRVVTVFSDSHMYAVQEICSLTGYYYTLEGKTIRVDLTSSPTFADANLCPPSFPQTSAAYCVSPLCSSNGLKLGSLIKIYIAPNLQESFDFKADGSLLCHWKGNKCYNSDGSSCGTRRYVKN